MSSLGRAFAKAREPDADGEYAALEDGAPSPPRKISRRFSSLQTTTEGMGFWGAVNALLISMMGAGIVAFPYAIALCGYVMGPLALLAVFALAHEAYCYLARCTQLTGFASYDGLLTTLPAAWGKTATFGLGLLLVLASASYIIIAVDTLRIVAAALVGQGAEASEVVLVAGLLAFMYPLCLTRSINGLAAATTSCFLSVVFVGCAIIWLSVGQRTVEPPLTTPVVATSGMSMLRAVPIIATSVFGHVNFPRIYAELDHDTKSRASSISLVACGACFLLYVGVGIAGYAAFGPGATPDVVAQLALKLGEGRIIAMVQFCILVFVVLKTPLIVFPLRSLTLAASRSSATLPELSRTKNALLSLTILFSIGVMTLLIPDLSTLMDLLGAVCCVPLTFVVPARLIFAQECSTRWRSVSVGIMGVAMSALSLFAVFRG